MRRWRWPWQDRGDNDAGEPPPPGTSGTRTRAAVVSEDAAPCTTFDEVYRRHKPYAYRVVAARVKDPGAREDIVQQSFVIVARKIRDYKGVPPHITQLVVTIVEGVINNHLRVERRRRIDGEPDGDVVPASWPDPQEQLEGAERGEAAKAALHSIFAQMTAYERQIIELFHIDGLTLIEIGELVDRKPKTVAVDLTRARDKFRRVGQGVYDLLNGSRRKS